MAELLRLFVSATQDLDAERAVIGRALAALPVEVGMEIRRTPATGAPIEAIHEAVANVDRFYFLMGEDITAPAGAEWYLAWTLERSVLPLRHARRATPAAEQFLRGLPVQWMAYSSGAHLARIVTLDVVRLLTHPANRYGLRVTDLELLSTHAARVGASDEMAARLAGPAALEPGGAEGGGVLLDMGRREPLLGVPLLDEKT